MRKNLSIIIILNVLLFLFNNNILGQCTPPTITATSPVNICSAGSVTLNATPSAGATVNWYTTASGGTSVYTGNAYTVTPSNTTTYYVESSTSGTITITSGLTVQYGQSGFENNPVSTGHGYIRITPSSGSVQNYVYSGSVQTTPTLPAGSYKLECWGANGGSGPCYAGGKGGYSKGTITLSSAVILYVYVGGSGVAGTASGGSTGGFNGGGSVASGAATASGSGGGASHIATATGVLSSLVSNQAAVLIVAGGGGGGSYANNENQYGGNGGGTTGQSGGNIGTNAVGGGGTQTAGGDAGLMGSPGTSFAASTSGSFGQGGNGGRGTGNASGTTYTNHSGGAGGGGWYGGGGSTAHYWGRPGGGGSGYVGSASAPCVSNRIPVVINITPIANPTATTPINTCAGTSVTLNASTTTPSATINWYANSSAVTPLATGTSYTITATSTTTYYVEATTGGSASATITNGLTVQPVQAGFIAKPISTEHGYVRINGNGYSYTGTLQTLTLSAGTHTLECWGANGGNRATTIGGKGGYSKATLTLTASTLLNIYVGGKGTDGGTGVGTASAGGWNGGGNGGEITVGSNSYGKGGGGGGASDIRIGGTAYSNRIIVAGGGAGAGGDTSGEVGFDGGGTNGLPLTPGLREGGGGTQSAGGIAGGMMTATGLNSTAGSLGIGGNAAGSNATTTCSGGGGGGGYYGGGGGGNSNVVHTSGGGGSGYIANSVINIGGTGCTSSKIPIVVNVTPALSVNITPISPEITCTNSTTTLTANPSGGNGSGSYTYSWSAGSPTSSQQTTVSSAGNYKVTVTSGYCSATATTTVNNTIITIASPTNVIASPNEICIGASTTLSANLPAGATINWYNAASGTTVISTSNPYNVIPTSTGTLTYYAEAVISNCTSNKIPVTVTVTPAITVTISSNPSPAEITCTNSSVQLTANPSGGNGTNIFTWTGGSPNGGSNPTAASTNVSPTITTTYTVSVSSGSCSATASIPVNYNITSITPPTASASPAHICKGSSTSLYANTSATVNWYDQQSGGSILSNNNPYTIIPLSTTTYYAEAVVGTCISNRYPVVVIVDPTVSVNISPNPVTLTCYNPTEILTANAIGGTGSYTYTWSGGVQGLLPLNQVTVSNGGTYNVVVQSGECSANASVTVNNNIETISPTITNNSGTIILTCSQSSISVTANGGDSYVWSGGLGNSANAIITNSGEYKVTATVGSCTGVATINISQDNDQPNIIMPIPDNITCLQSSISVNPTVTGGTTPYNFLWSGGSNINTQTNNFTIPNTYTLIVTGDNGCTKSASITINIDTIHPIPMITMFPNSPILNCNINQIQLTASGGGTYMWNGASAGYLGTNTNITISAADAYTLIVTNPTNGCTKSKIQTIINAPPLIINHVEGNISCFGGTTNITITASGGTTPYSGIGTFNVGAGNHSYTITDNGGCTENITIQIPEPTLLTANATVSQSIHCNGEKGTIFVSAQGGTTPYNNIGYHLEYAGNYTYTVTDANGCTATTNNIQLIQPNQLIATAVIATPIKCYGETAIIQVSAQDGIAPYSGIGNFNVTAGTYDYLITDNNGCTATTNQINIIQPPQLTAIVDITTPIKCFGEKAVITVNATGGNPDYTGMGEFVVKAGQYNYTIRDVNGCSTTASINVTEPELLIATASIKEAIKCFSGEAKIFVTATGGTSPYSGVGEISTFAGEKTLTVIDANNCVATTTQKITQPEKLELTIIQTAKISCYGKKDAVIQVNTRGGAVGGKTYLWNIGTTNEVLENIAAGEYRVTVTDINACTAIAEYAVEQPNKLTFNLYQQDVSCFGKNDAYLEIIAQGGKYPYSYKIINEEQSFNGRKQNNLFAGNYSCIIEDRNLCSVDTNIIINEPPQISANLDINSPTCVKAKNGFIDCNIAGGVPPYMITVGSKNYGKVNTIKNLSSGFYNIKITDATGCESIYPNIKLTDEEKECLTIPNVFTPNGDGINDTWIIDGLSDFDDIVLGIFNRWGQKIYETNNYEYWDGKYNNKVVPAGTYLYVVMIYGEKKYSGTITVVY